MLDSLYQGAQSILNKDQLGYLKPIDFNLHVRYAVRKMYNKYLLELKSSVRKMNWMLDGKDFANYSEHTRQLLEYYSFITPISLSTNFPLPTDCEFVEDVFDSAGVRVDKIHYSDYMDLQRNIYANPTACSPICAKVGTSLIVSPISIDPITLHYLRKPKTAKWTFQVVDGKPMFDDTANDFQDVDMPESSYDELLSLIVLQSSKTLRALKISQLENTNKQQDVQEENKQ